MTNWRGSNDEDRLFNAQAAQRFFQQRRVDDLAAMRFQVLQFIESSKQAQLGGGVLLGVAKRPSVLDAPCGLRVFAEKDADCIGKFAVGRDVENKLDGWGLRVVFKSRTLADEIVLIDVALGSGVGLQTARC